MNKKSLITGIKQELSRYTLLIMMMHEKSRVTLLALHALKVCVSNMYLN